MLYISPSVGRATGLSPRWHVTLGLGRVAYSPASNGTLGRSRRTMSTTSSFSLGHAERHKTASRLGLNTCTTSKSIRLSLYSSSCTAWGSVLEPAWKRSYRTSSQVSWPASTSTTSESTPSTPYNYAGAGTFASALRKPGIYSKLLFRKDGTPRSKLKGLLLATVSISMLGLIYALMFLIEQYETSGYLLLCLVHFQRTDADLFSSLDITSLQSLSAYFQELCRAFEGISTHLIDDFCQDIVKLEGKQAEGVQAALREIAEKIHRILGESKENVPWETAYQAILAIDEGLTKMLRAVEENRENGGEDDEGKRKVDEEEEARKALRNQQIKEKMKDQTARGGSGDYEVLG